MRQIKKIGALWNRFGFHGTLIVLAGIVLFVTMPKAEPESPAVQMDMKKLILYERVLNTDVVLVEEDDGVTIVIALWNEDWAGTTIVQDFVAEYDPIILLLDTSVGAIVEVDGEIYYGAVYSGIGMASCVNGDCDSGPLSGVLNDPEAVDWDWGRR